MAVILGAAAAGYAAARLRQAGAETAPGAGIPVPSALPEAHSSRLPSSETLPSGKPAEAFSPIILQPKGTPPAFPSPNALHHWADRLAAADPETLPALTAEILSLPAELLPDGALALFAAKWAETAPLTGLAEILKSAPQENRHWTLRRLILGEWALLDPAAAWQTLSRGSPETKDLSADSVSELLRHEDPEVLWQWFRLSGRPLPEDGRDADWLSIAALHPEEVERLALEKAAAGDPAPGGPGAGPQPPGSADARRDAGFLAAALARIKADRDPPGALAWAQALPLSIRNAATAAVLGRMALTDPDGTLAKLNLLQPQASGPQRFEAAGDAEIRQSILRKMLAARGPAEGMEYLRSRLADFGNDSQSLKTALSGRLTEAVLDGSLAPRDLISGLMKFGGDTGVVLQGSVLSEIWSRLPPETLARTAQELTAGGNPEGGRARDNALRDLVGQWARKDPATAMAFTRSLPDSGIRQAIYSTALNATHIGGLTDAAERFRTLAGGMPPEERAALIRDDLRLYYTIDPARQGDRSLEPVFQGGKFASLLRETPPSPERDEAMGILGSRWGMDDPESALAWVSTETDPAARMKAFGAVVDGWVKSDAYGVSEWAESLPAGADRDAAAIRLAAAVSDTEPDSAWAWAGSITDPEARLAAQAAVLRSWQTLSPAEAEAATATLDPATRQRLPEAIEALPPPKK